jgi:thiol-disulfide isomerase/thioredoxin
MRLVIAAAVLSCATLARAGGPAEAVPRAQAPTPVAATSADVRRAVVDAKAKAVLVNVWATWCLPCREELPDLLRARRELRDDGFELLLVTTDFEGNVPQAVKFLGQQGVDFTTYRKAENDQSFVTGLSPAWSGVLPASMLFDGGGTLRQTWEGRITYANLTSEIRKVLDTATSTPGVHP